MKLVGKYGFVADIMESNSSENLGRIIVSKGDWVKHMRIPREGHYTQRSQIYNILAERFNEEETDVFYELYMACVDILKGKRERNEVENIWRCDWVVPTKSKLEKDALREILKESDENKGSLWMLSGYTVCFTAGKHTKIIMSFPEETSIDYIIEKVKKDYNMDDCVVEQLESKMDEMGKRELERASIIEKAEQKEIKEFIRSFYGVGGT